jgi:hypothetical protein
MEYLMDTKQWISGDNYTVIARRDLETRPVFIVCEISVTTIGDITVHGTFSTFDDALARQVRVHKEEDDYIRSFNTVEELV